jgi:hypothetical protein
MNYSKATHYADAWATATREKKTRGLLVFGKPDQEPVRDPGSRQGDKQIFFFERGGEERVTRNLKPDRETTKTSQAQTGDRRRKGQAGTTG